MKSFQLESSPKQLMAKAREATGINIVDGDIEEALGRLVQSLNTEAALNEAGAAGMEYRVLNILRNRLRMLRDFARHPEINEQKIVRPHILTGAGRSGSTKLHKLLAASGDFKYLKFWEQYNPSLISGDRNESPDARIQDTEAFLRWFDQHTPQAKIIHAYKAFEAEEETFLFDHSRFLINFNITHTSLPGYTQWILTQDITPQLEFLKRAIQYLQWQFHDGDARPWLLKSPLYGGMEPLLSQLFPDAVFVSTHREPYSRIASSAGLVACMQKAYSDADRSRYAGPFILEFMAQGANQFLASRDAFPEVKILDVAYSTLTNDSARVAEDIYRFANRPLAEKSRQAMQQWEQQNHQHKLGVYKYALEDFFVTRDMVSERFKAYSERFCQYF